MAFWLINPTSSAEADVSGHGNTGSYQGGIPATAAMPNGDTAADFNGTNQNLRVTSNPSFSITTTGDLTWEAWIRPDVLQFPRSSSDGFVAFMGKCATYGSPPTCEWESRMYDMAYDTWFQGAIGKVAIYNYRLSQTQINNHYQTMTGAQPTGSCRGTCSFQ